MDKSTESEIKETCIIGNNCGSIYTKFDSEKYYVSVVNGFGEVDWREVTEKLYNALIEFEEKGMDDVFIKHGSGELLPEPAEGFIWKWKGIDDEGVKYKLVKS